MENQEKREKNTSFQRWHSPQMKETRRLIHCDVVDIIMEICGTTDNVEGNLFWGLQMLSHRIYVELILSCPFITVYVKITLCLSYIFIIVFILFHSYLHKFSHLNLFQSQRLNMGSCVCFLTILPLNYLQIKIQKKLYFTLYARHSFEDKAITKYKLPKVTNATAKYRQRAKRSASQMYFNIYHSLFMDISAGF